MEIVIEALAEAAHLPVEFFFAGVRERRMADVVRQCQRLSQVLIQAERGGDGAGKLRDFDRVRQPVPKVIRIPGAEDLRLVFETPKGARMNNAVAIALKRIAERVRDLWVATSARSLFREA